MLTQTEILSEFYWWLDTNHQFNSLLKDQKDTNSYSVIPIQFILFQSSKEEIVKAIIQYIMSILIDRNLTCDLEQELKYLEWYQMENRINWKINCKKKEA